MGCGIKDQRAFRPFTVSSAACLAGPRGGGGGAASRPQPGSLGPRPVSASSLAPSLPPPHHTSLAFSWQKPQHGAGARLALFLTPKLRGLHPHATWVVH